VTSLLKKGKQNYQPVKVKVKAACV